MGQASWEIPCSHWPLVAIISTWRNVSPCQVDWRIPTRSIYVMHSCLAGQRGCWAKPSEALSWRKAAWRPSRSLWRRPWSPGLIILLENVSPGWVQHWLPSSKSHISGGSLLPHAHRLKYLSFWVSLDKMPCAVRDDHMASKREAGVLLPFASWLLVTQSQLDVKCMVTLHSHKK
jgi:hypothetical protein